MVTGRSPKVALFPDFGAFGKDERIPHIGTEITEDALNLGAAKNDTHCTQDALCVSDYRSLRAPLRVGAEPRAFKRPLSL